jgi:hypothetical protein
MAGLNPAIQQAPLPSETLKGRLDARIKSGHDESGAISVA